MTVDEKMTCDEASVLVHALIDGELERRGGRHRSRRWGSLREGSCRRHHTAHQTEEGKAQHPVRARARCHKNPPID